ncbi:T9SS type A sorting domain-containing protein [Tenacibaculum sp. 190524A02b]|uniref:T9SS type A sorting domain-containing protein n=1 Tax=Tenacibaculum vairaonense TaxID=3137860 RepID=UPI0031FAA4CA
MKLKLLKALCLIMITHASFCQNFIEKQLPTPENLSSFFIGPLINSTIHYGAKPSNYNGEVIIFNHGYIDLNQLYFSNNTYYEEAYNAGYQAVFVATTRGEGMWENGKLLAESIDIITEKYKVKEVYIVAHSNGGKASEVAMFHHGKYNKVKKVFALGTPYWGTYLADLSQQWWFNWLWKKTGLNEGSATSTTYYSKDVVRPFFDNHPNNQPEKFVILGTSGFASGHTPIAPLMLASGGILYLHQGTNDGVAPYSSTLRPNGEYVFSKGASKLDHIDVALGQYTWKHILPYLKGLKERTPVSNNSSKNIDSKIISDYQIIHSENDYDNIYLDKGNSSAVINLFHTIEHSDLELKTNNGVIERLRGRNNNTPLNSTYVLNSLSNKIELEAKGKYTALVHQPNGPKMIFKKKDKELIISFINTNAEVDNIEVNMTITKTNNLLGNKSPEETFMYSLNSNRTTKDFRLNTSVFDEGVYSIFITGKHTDFKRSLITGFTVGELNVSKLKSLQQSFTNDSFLSLKSNLISNELQIIDASIIKNTQIDVSLYNIHGQKIITKNLNNNGNTYLLNTSNLTNGLYLLNVNRNGIQKTFKVIKK